MLKANKKIEETKKKTIDIRLIKEQNDHKYILKLEKDKEAKAMIERNKQNIEKRFNHNKELKEKRYQMFLSKRREAEQYKMELHGYRSQFTQFRKE